MYFSHLQTVEEIKKEFRRLAMIHHPDHGGNTATMQEINAQYHAALSRCHGQTSRGSDQQDHTYHYNPEKEQAIVDKIAELIAAGVAGVAEIYLIGTWVWVMGETKPIKETLKTLGCIWHNKRQAWYWQNDNEKRGYNRKADFFGLAAKYGAQKFEEKKEEQKKKITA